MENEVSWEDFDKWIEAKRRYELKESKPKSVPCPKCGNRAILQAVNTKPCDQVEGSWKSMYMCDNCGWNQMNLKTVSNVSTKKPKRNRRIIRPDEHRMLYYGRRRI